jgi:hypothetical protein
MAIAGPRRSLRLELDLPAGKYPLHAAPTPMPTPISLRDRDARHEKPTYHRPMPHQTERPKILRLHQNSPVIVLAPARAKTGHTAAPAAPPSMASIY